MPSNSLPSRLNQFHNDTLGCANAGELDTLHILPKNDSFTNDLISLSVDGFKRFRALGPWGYMFASCLALGMSQGYVGTWEGVFILQDFSLSMYR